MKTRITITSGLLTELHWLLAASGEVVTLSAGFARSAGRFEFLLPAGAGTATVCVFRLPDGSEAWGHGFEQAMPDPSRGGPHAALGLHPRRGCIARAFVDGRTLAVDEVLVAGAGMLRWAPGIAPVESTGTVPTDGMHSRYMGALGGQAAHDRLRRIRVLGIGTARLGSVVAAALACAGCERQYLVDPDALESHSLDAVECLPRRAQGQSKVTAVAEFLRGRAPWCEVVPMQSAADGMAAREAVRDVDLVCSAPDRDDARFAAALLATAYHRLHLDVGTGVFEENGRWRAGADVRLVMPGEGCLLCVGGLDLQARPEPDWRRQRAGSLRSLNQIAANAAMLLFERCIAGEQGRTTWLRIEVARDGAITTRRMEVVRDRTCPLCGRWAGAGDFAFAHASAR